MSTRNNETILERFNRNRSELEDIAYDETAHILDRVDAFLELAQLIHRDGQAWAYIREARDLIREEFNSAT